MSIMALASAKVDQAGIQGHDYITLSTVEFIALINSITFRNPPYSNEEIVDMYLKAPYEFTFQGMKILITDLLKGVAE